MSTIQTAYRNALKPGQLLSRYEVIDVLGQGSFGITYLCRDTLDENQVAIKEYLPGQFAHREEGATLQPISAEHEEDFLRGLARFISEAAHLDRFVHPNIVRILDVFQANNTAYLVMKYEQGESLYSLLAQNKALSEEELRSILLPVLDGLEAMHSEGLIHRDIKPSNIFIRTDGSPVLLDFGSARLAMERFSQTLTNIVSPGYAPIEQYATKRDKQGPWTDIYGLGATLYKAVTGIAPVEAVARAEAIVHDGRDPYVPALKRVGLQYSQALLAAIDNALQFRSHERPQTVAEWRDGLLNYEASASSDDFAEEHDDAPTQPAPKHTRSIAQEALARSGSSLSQGHKRSRRRRASRVLKPAAGAFFAANLLVAAASAFVAPSAGLDSATVRTLAHRDHRLLASIAPLPRRDLTPATSFQRSVSPNLEAQELSIQLSASVGTNSPSTPKASMANKPDSASEHKSRPASAALHSSESPPKAVVAQPVAKASSETSRSTAADATTTAARTEPVGALLKLAATETGLIKPGSYSRVDPLARYHQVLALDPDNRSAKAGLAQTANKYLDVAQAEIEANDLTNAAAHLRTAAKELRNTERFKQVRKTLRTKRNLLALQHDNTSVAPNTKVGEFVPDLARHSPTATQSRFDELRKRMAGETILP